MHEGSLMLAGGFLLGAAHAFDPDHVSAITAFIARRPGRFEAVQFAVRWGCGHMMILALAGSAVFSLKWVFPEFVSKFFEMVVGVALIFIGVWLFCSLLRVHSHTHTHPGGESHIHYHSHRGRPGHEHRHATFALGILHGLAGTASFLVLIPASFAPNAAGVLVFIGAFGAAMILMMTLYALVAGSFLEVLARFYRFGYSSVLGGVALINLGLGCLWLYEGIRS